MNRRQFISKMNGVVWLIPGLFFIGLLNRHRRVAVVQDEVRISKKMLPGIYFYDEVLVNMQGEIPAFFSAHCTHLGCRIKSLENDAFICPCHGSVFSLNGQVVKGPATRNLEALEFSQDAVSGEYIIKLPLR